MLKLVRYLAVVFGLLLLIVILRSDSSARADGNSTWLSPSPLNLKKEADADVLPSSVSGNIDCYQDSLGCVIGTPYGLANTSSEIELSGTKSYTPVFSYIDGHQHFIPVPNSPTVITFTTEPAYGLYLYFNSSFTGSVTSSEVGGNIQYQINRPPDATLSDKNNHRLAADYSSISFSENGQWMVVSEPNVAMLRVNLEDFQVTPFAPGFDYTLGLNPDPQTAISNDGRYVSVGSKNFNRFNIYDLDTCGPVPDTITEPVICQSRDLRSIMDQQVDKFITARNIRFIDDDEMSLYAVHGQTDAQLITKFILGNSNDAPNQLDYLALGDSYISGEGAFDYQPGTDTDDNTCHLSLVSYPFLLGHDLNFNSYHSIACSGATTNDMTNKASSYAGQVKNGVNRLDLTKDGQLPSILDNFQPGYIDQLDFVSTYQPKIITLSVGGNDIGFSDKLQDCLGKGTCYSTYEDRLEFVEEVNSKFSTFVNTYSKIKAAGAPDTRIYVIGYPQIAMVGGDCAANVHMNSDELIFTQEAIDYLDQVIQAAAAKAGVTYVDIQDSLYGHRLCEAKPGSVAINGVTGGNDYPARFGGPIGRETYHPNDFGHELIEQAILSKTNNLTEPMPPPNLDSALPSSAGLEILNAPATNRTTNTTEYDSAISDDVLFKQTLNVVNVDGTTHLLSSLVTLEASLHSDVVSLGSFTTDGLGNISGQITIPDTVPAGYHTLNFYGTDLAGRPVDIYKVVYVADSPTDWDGDGIDDSAEQCVGVGTVAQDTDRDGIDDSCDSNIAVSDAASTALKNPEQAEQKPATGSNIPNHSGDAVSPTPAKTNVLAASTARPMQEIADPSLVVSQEKSLNPKLLAAIAGASVFVVVCYAAWEFRT